MFDKFIDEFIPVAKLREYLKNANLSDSSAADIIVYSKTPITRKRDALYELENMDIPDDRKWAAEFWRDYRKSIDKALQLINSKDAVFVVTEYFMEDGDTEADEYMLGMYSSYDAAVSFIKNDLKSKADLEDYINWYEIDLWLKDSDDSYKETCSYCFIDGELCYIDFSIEERLPSRCIDGELYIPVHYKPGDILIADGYPFGRKIKFVMLQIGDNNDCCCLQALSIRKDGSWDVGAVKHGMIGEWSYPRVSLLYTADTYIPDLSIPEDAILAKVSELVAGSEERGTVIWDKIAYDGVANDKEMWKVLEDVEKVYLYLT